MNSASTPRPFGPAFPVRGIFPSDPHTPPAPPATAEACEVMTATGRRIGWFWADIDANDTETRELVMKMAYDYLDAADPITVSGPQLVK